MKKLILLIGLTLPLMGQAQPPEGQDWWACQSVESGGLIWKNGQWKSTGFNHDERFILIGDEENIVTLESIAKAIGAFPDWLVCNLWPRANTVSCISRSSETFVFDSAAAKGATGNMFGSMMLMKDYKDTLNITVFECAKG